MPRSLRPAFVGLIVLVLTAAVILVPDASEAQVPTCSGTVAIANGGFESPAVDPGTRDWIMPDGWTSTLEVTLFGPRIGFPSGSQYVHVGDPHWSQTIDQTIDQDELAGAEVTFTTTFVGVASTITFNGETQSLEAVGVIGTSTFLVPANDPGPYLLSLGGFPIQIDSISATYTKPCPTNTPTNTPTETPTNTPTNTPTSTPAPTETPTNTPTTEPTSIPTEVPDEDVELTVTGDPRFPVTGSVALDTPGLGYVLVDPPDNGVVTLLPNGTFTYVAASPSVTGDQFVVQASDGTTITVTLVLAVDPSVPTYGKVKPGGTGNGGPEEDARHPGSTAPDNDDGDAGSDDDDEGPVEAR